MPVNDKLIMEAHRAHQALEAILKTNLGAPAANAIMVGMYQYTVAQMKLMLAETNVVQFR